MLFATGFGTDTSSPNIIIGILLIILIFFCLYGIYFIWSVFNIFERGLGNCVAINLNKKKYISKYDNCIFYTLSEWNDLPTGESEQDG
jgi:hypothetical protein